MATHKETVEFILGKLRDSRAILALLAVLLLFLVGCSRSAEKSKANEVLVSWLESHGETNIVQARPG